MRRQSSAEVSTSGPTAPMIPALLNMQSSRPQVVDGQRDGRRDLILVGHVGGDEAGDVAELLGGGLAGLDLDVGDDDPSALVDEALRGGPADAARRAGDDRDLSVQTTCHALSPVLMAGSATGRAQFL